MHGMHKYKVISITLLGFMVCKFDEIKAIGWVWRDVSYNTGMIHGECIVWNVVE